MEVKQHKNKRKVGHNSVKGGSKMVNAKYIFSTILILTLLVSAASAAETRITTNAAEQTNSSI